MYYARILPSVGIYEVCDLIVRTVEEDYFTGIESHTKHVYLFDYSYVDTFVFFYRSKALQLVLEAEKHKTIFTNEKYYEEY